MPSPALNEGSTRTAKECGVITNNYGKLCGRPIHSALEHDNKPVCLMHSKDPAKSGAEFQAEIGRILDKAEDAGTAANFSNFVFPTADYWRREFVPQCLFTEAVFTQRATFSCAKFKQVADFSRAEFIQDAVFLGAKFGQDARFDDTRFTQDADFTMCEFTRDVFFNEARFGQGADFSQAMFGSIARFIGTRFAGGVAFRGTIFRNDPHDAPGLDFSDVTMEHPEKVEFYQTNLGRALFYNTDVSRFDFTLVEWRHRGRTGWLRRLTGRSLPARLCLFEEDMDLKIKFQPDPDLESFNPDPPLKSEVALQPLEDGADERNYSLIAETYQQLKRNYDAKGDYWTAGHWHYGEMEMKRLHSRWRSRPLRWLSHHFSLVALYKYASAYGESYLVPLAWLLGVITAFAILFPIAGLELNKDSGGGVVGYWNITDFFRMHPAEHPSGWLGLTLHGFMTSISVAGFQRELKYAPSYPWGRLLALVELLLTTTLAGLFALALRRQFKRS